MIEYAQLGALGIIFLFAIKEFFGYLRARKEKETPHDYNQDTEIALLKKEISHTNLMLTNCITTIQKDIDEIKADIKELVKKNA